MGGREVEVSDLDPPEMGLSTGDAHLRHIIQVSRASKVCRIRSKHP
jgi:hypothetical protein